MPLLIKRQGKQFAVAMLLCGMLAACTDSDRTVTGVDLSGEVCSYGSAVETDGVRRLALVVGVGKYKNAKVPSLVGPPNDARRIYALLTGDKGYGFPKQNVCLLLDEQATMAKFREAFDKALVDRAVSNKDSVVIFFAGHGSQTRDRNGDEPDNMDETFLLSDSRTDGQGDLIDDEFNAMLAKLYKKTPHITMITDSCNSGTSMRGENGTYTARFAQAMDDSLAAAGATAGGDGGHEWIPESMPGLIALTAASDGTSALETNGFGIFTDALVQVLSGAQDKPFTYAQLARQVPSLVAARSYQIPYFQGDLNQVVFGNTTRDRPRAWELTSVEPILLAGTPMAGMGKRAELRVYDGAATGSTTRDPGKAKATLTVDSASDINATARVIAKREGAAPLQVGDIAVLVRPSDSFIKIKLRLRPTSEPGGLTVERQAAIRQSIDNDLDTSLLVEITGGAADYELVQSFDGRLQLMGPENTVRNTFNDDKTIPKSLWQHARQRGLLALRGEGGTLYTDNETLKVQLVPSAKQGPCAKGVWTQAPPNSEQIIPLCHAWNVQVSVSEKSPTPLLVGGVILSTDGGIYGFPVDGRTVMLRPGEQAILNAAGETFRGMPPLDVVDRVMVFGTQETEPMAWHQLTSPTAARASSGKRSALQQSLETYLSIGERGVGTEAPLAETSPWTVSSLAMRVEANSRFLSTKADESPIAKREYTLSQFNIAPYRPDDPTTALYKVLAKADALVNASTRDGIGYKQHAWSQPSDEKNLQVGIDCSRFVWYVFTRSGLPYNSKNEYLPTVSMVGASSKMNEQFTRCDDDPVFKLGDVLVYRDDGKGDGHTVMVIDAEKRIAVGSHGWDGNAREIPSGIADTGVEYQKIKYKKDMKRWDRTTMHLKACWRYRQFSEQASKPGGQPGTKALAGICDAANRCGVRE